MHLSFVAGWAQTTHRGTGSKMGGAMLPKKLQEVDRELQVT